VLDAPDRIDLLEWVRHRPLMHAEGGWALVHAGLLPEWTVVKARSLAHEVEDEMRGPGYRAFLARMYGDEPTRWDDALEGHDRLRVIVNAMTRMRVLDDYGTMVLSFKGEPGDAHDQWTPWFDYPGRRSADHAIACGHWSGLGLMAREDVVSLDSGCVWGNTLSAVRLEDRCLFSVPCPRSKARAG